MKSEEKWSRGKKASDKKNPTKLEVTLRVGEGTQHGRQVAASLKRDMMGKALRYSSSRAQV